MPCVLFESCSYFYWVNFSSSPLVINALLEFLGGRGSWRVLTLFQFFIYFYQEQDQKSNVLSALDPFKIKRYGTGDFIGAPEPGGFHHPFCGFSLWSLPQSVDSAVTWSTIQMWTNLTGSALWISPSSCGIFLWSCGPHVEFLRQFLTTQKGATSQNLRGGNHLRFIFWLWYLFVAYRYFFRFSLWNRCQITRNNTARWSLCGLFLLS